MGIRHFAKWLPWVSPILFGLALFLLHRELAGHSIREIVEDLSALSSTRVAFAVGLTACCFVVLSGYDTLALHYLKQSIAYRLIALGSFCGYAFSNTLGMAGLASIPVRYQIYAAHGLSGLQVSQIVLFDGLTFWLGFCTAAGLVFVIEAPALPEMLHFGLTTARPLGFGLLTVVAIYLALGFIWRRPIKIGRWEFLLPAWPIRIAQVGVSSLDWTLAGGVLFLLLPPTSELTFGTFLGFFLLAQVVGLVSHVPGGLGVFESVMLMTLTPALATSAVFGGLILFRLIYYVLPLLTATVILTVRVVRLRPGLTDKLLATSVTLDRLLVPNLITAATFIGGVVLLFSGAYPSDPSRMRWLDRVLPLAVVEMSHFVGSLVGLGLLLLARGLQHRLSVAWLASMVLLACGVLSALLKGLDYEEAAILTVLLVATATCRRYFDRPSKLRAVLSASPAWIAAVAVVIGASIWLGWFSYKHVAYRDDLWWQFAFHADAPRFLRATVGVLIAAIVAVGWALVRPAAVHTESPTTQELDCVLPLVRSCRDTAAHLALVGDKSLLLNEAETGFIMYAVEGRSWVALRDPVGCSAVQRELIWEFRELAGRNGGWGVFYQVSADCLPVYVDAGLTLTKLGEEARVPLSEFSLEGAKHKGFRRTVNRLAEEGCRFEVLPVEQTASLIPALREVSDAWLAEKHAREKGFSLGYFDEAYLNRCPLAVVRQGDKIVAFANLWLGADKEELSLDLMRYQSVAPSGTMEYLFVELMLWGHEQGYRWFNLGMAPLSGIEAGPFAPMWHRLGNSLYHHGEHFYNFQGLRQYKEKFHPVWEPKYLASPGGLTLPIILTNLTTLVSGGVRGLWSK